MQVYILDALRTPVVPSGGGLKSLVIKYLAVPVVKKLMERQDISPLSVEHFIMGSALSSGGNPARSVSLLAGLPESSMALTIDTNSNSGMDAIILAAEKIKAGVADIVIAGGAESVSRRPIRAYRPINETDKPITSGRPAYTPWPGADPSMQDSNERIAIDGSISEEMQQQWLKQSLKKAVNAKGKLAAEKITFNEEDILNKNASDICMEDLGYKLRKSENSATDVLENGCIRAHSADAAAFTILVNDHWLEKNGYTAPVMLFDTKTMGSAADDPSWAMIDSCRAIMLKNSICTESLSVIEMNESYAAQTLYCLNELGFDQDLVNLAGGDLARGNSLAAGSSVLFVRLFHELLAKQKGELGLAASAASGGIGSAVIMQAC